MLKDAITRAGGLSAFARRIPAKQQEVWNWLNGRPIPANRCPAIELADQGQTAVEELRPDTCWVRVPDPAWPHPKGRPCIDVAAAAGRAA